LAGNLVQISVSDEGIGIEPRDKEKLFERYYRAENSFTRHTAGSGIGLYLCAEIIQRHEGKIWVNSQPGVGSTFHFSLPTKW
jgi:signal transduction histidine kinase